MSNIIVFKTVSFNKDLYSHSYVSSNNLIIELTNGATLAVEFDSSLESNAALKELAMVLNGEPVNKSKPTDGLDMLVNKILNGKSSEIVELLKNCTDKITETVSTAKSKAEDKLYEEAFKVVGAAAEYKLNGMINNLDQVLSHMFTKEYETEEPESQEQPSKKEDVKSKVKSAFTGAKKKFGLSEDIFGYSDTTAQTDDDSQSDDILIGDMLDRQLRAEISAFVDSVVSSERAQDMFESISKNFGEEESKAAIDGFKNLIYSVAVQHQDKTLEYVIRNYFM
ncbi:hypothetical protein VWH97_05650 [Escherichia coli O157]|nr:hypothetical protein [Escherichia coli O157]